MITRRSLTNIGVRGVDEDVWLAYRAHCVRTGRKLGPAITDTMRRDIRRMEAEDRIRAKRR